MYVLSPVVPMSHPWFPVRDIVSESTLSAEVCINDYVGKAEIAEIWSLEMPGGGWMWWINYGSWWIMMVNDG